MSFAGLGSRQFVGNTEAVANPTQNLLAAAQQGDENAFAELLDGFRGELHAHCYRMLGSLHDADDACQEVLLRAWRGISGFEGRSSVRRWLYRVATNVCLTMIAQRAKRVLPMDLTPAAEAGERLGEPLAEPVWLEPYPDSSDDSRFNPDARLERQGKHRARVRGRRPTPARQRTCGAAAARGDRLFGPRSRRACRRDRPGGQQCAAAGSSNRQRPHPDSEPAKHRPLDGRYPAAGDRRWLHRRVRARRRRRPGGVAHR